MCVEAVVYVINRIPSSVLDNKAPYELLYKHEPNLSHLRVIGCKCYATSLVKQDKFSPRAIRSLLLGYSSHQKSYKLLNLETRSVFVSGVMGGISVMPHAPLVALEPMAPWQASKILVPWMDLGSWSRQVTSEHVPMSPH